MAGDHGHRTFVLVAEPVSLPRGGGRVERRGIHRAAAADRGEASTSVTSKPSQALSDEENRTITRKATTTMRHTLQSVRQTAAVSTTKAIDMNNKKNMTNYSFLLLALLMPLCFRQLPLARIRSESSWILTPWRKSMINMP